MQSLQVAQERGYQIAALGAGKNLSLLAEQVAQCSPELVSVHESIYTEAAKVFSHLPLRLTTDPCEVATHPADVVVGAISGLVGLAPTRAALEAGQALALATKEAMVTASHLMWDAAKRGGGRLIPIDSEHTGVYQCLLGERLEDVRQIILTASGGPFRERLDLSSVTPAEALQHPSWNMGAKVTIDSATLFNKGLEVMECASLYGVPLSRVGVVIHPQSIVHAAVRLRDGSLKAQFGATDMRLPIAYAIEAAPAGMRWAGDIRAMVRADLSDHWDWLGEWQFFKPDGDRFPCLGLAYEAGERGGLAPVVLNAADEVAVEAFLAGHISYLQIPKLLETLLAETPSGDLTWQSLYEADGWARERAAAWVASC